ncbi:hypothetical protein MHYP_G00304060 [Metynnis hypsauchen]
MRARQTREEGGQTAEEQQATCVRLTCIDSVLHHCLQLADIFRRRTAAGAPGGNAAPNAGVFSPSVRPRRLRRSHILKLFVGVHYVKGFESQTFTNHMVSASHLCNQEVTRSRSTWWKLSLTTALTSAP